MSLLKAFLQDIAADPRKRQALGIGDQMLAELQAEAASSDGKWRERTWVVATPQAGDWEAIIRGAKIAVSAYRDGRIYRPWAIRKVGDEIWIGSEWQRISRWDQNWSFLGYWNPDGWGDWQNPLPHQWRLDRHRGPGKRRRRPLAPGAPDASPRLLCRAAR